jgi:hypothetical protein
MLTFKLNINRQTFNKRLRITIYELANELQLAQGISINIVSP